MTTAPKPKDNKLIWFSVGTTVALIITLAVILAAVAVSVPTWGVMTAAGTVFFAVLAMFMAIYNFFT